MQVLTTYFLFPRKPPHAHPRIDSYLPLRYPQIIKIPHVLYACGKPGILSFIFDKVAGCYPLDIGLNPIQPSIAFHSRLFCFAKQMTGFYMKRNTGLEWVKVNVHEMFSLHSLSRG